MSRTSTTTRFASRARLSLAAFMTGAVLAGCTTAASITSTPLDNGSPRDLSTATEAATTPIPAAPASVARSTGAAVAVYDTPSAATPANTLPATTAFGTPTVLLVTEVGTGPTAGWLEVLLPVRPNGSTGWIAAADVEVREVSLELQVDLAERELTLLDEGEVVLITSAAIGDPEHPTPTGRFYVTDKLETPEPGGAYGPYALGLSAYSNVLTEFAGGDGQVGIHGTDAPDSIGRAVSHGCLRVANDVVTELAHLLPLGTPVTIA